MIGIAYYFSGSVQFLHIVADRDSMSAHKVTLELRKPSTDDEHGGGRQIALQIQTKIDRVIMPLLDELAECTEAHQAELVARLRISLSDISSPITGRLKFNYAGFSPRELEISNLIKNGLSSKEIAATLHTSEGTVRNQRKSIRRKLGLTKDKTNLQTALKTE